MVSLVSYGLFISGIVLGGLVLLVLYSLLAMAQKGDEFLDRYQLGSEDFEDREGAPCPIIRGKSEKLGVPATSDLHQDSAGPTRIFSRG
jgi:hypothetical protein